jgi:glyoxylase-like metal-dependent hydrolase (beta-lactamase superfamily II)
MRAWAFSAGEISASARLMEGKGSWTRGHRTSLTCILVERREGLVLIDSGWGSPTVRAPEDYPGLLFKLTAGLPIASTEQTALGRVRSLGFSPEQVTDIVLTHMDIDHVGGLVDFPHARVHVASAEYAARFERKQPFRSWVHDSRKAFAHKPKFTVAKLVDHAELGFVHSADLFGDGSITFLDAWGHTPGHCAVAVRIGSHTLVHAGDAFVDHLELEGEQALPPGVRLYRKILHENKPAARAALERLRTVHREGQATVINAHDASLLDKLPSFPQPFADD